jgi:thiol-disulfide isomerase/thioredoxin
MIKIKRFLILSLIFFTLSANATDSLQDLSGREISFADLKGKWVFINYWASWCETCLAEIPELNRFYEENKDNNVAFFAVNFDALPVHKIQRLIRKYDIRYPSLKNDPREFLNLGDISGVPVTFVFNPEGQLTDALYGGQSAENLKRALAVNF